MKPLANEIRAAIAALPKPTVPALRLVRRRYSQQLKSMAGPEVRDLALSMLQLGNWAGLMFACEFISEHPAAFASLSEKHVLRLGTGLDDWASVDCFACTIAGQAWREGILTDATVMKWVRSTDLWQRRLALAATIPLNSRARGGSGDAQRTLRICRELVDDREDMVVKAMSWALRELARRDVEAVRGFITHNEARLAPRVLREVRNKLTTGLKSPRLRS